MADPTPEDTEAARAVVKQWSDDPEVSLIGLIAEALAVTREREWAGAIIGIAEATIKRVLNHPMGVVCKHWMLECLIDEMERAGIEPQRDFVKAVMNADDEDALMLLTCDLAFVKPARDNQT